MIILAKYQLSKNLDGGLSSGLQNPKGFGGFLRHLRNDHDIYGMTLL